jgi:hypothetical protein
MCLNRKELKDVESYVNSTDVVYCKTNIAKRGGVPAVPSWRLE